MGSVRSPFNVNTMLQTVLLFGLVSTALSGYTDIVPEEPHEVSEMSNSARIEVSPSNVPDGTDRVHIKAKEINDLTGNQFENGYTYAYNPHVPYFYYPQLNAGKYHVFKVKFGRQNGDDVEWTQYTPETHFLHSDASRFSLDLTKRNWAMAKEACVRDGKRLAVIHGQKSNNMVRELLLANIQTLGQSKTAWIGLYDANYGDDNPRTTWTWVDGSPVNFENFEFGARVDQSEVSTAVGAMHVDGEWETWSPDAKMAFVCEEGITERVKSSEARVGLNEQEIVVLR